MGRRISQLAAPSDPDAERPMRFKKIPIAALFMATMLAEAGSAQAGVAW